MDGITLLLVLLGVLFGALYVVAQTHLAVRLVRLLRRPEEIITSDLVDSCFVTLCLLAGLVIFIPSIVIWTFLWFSGSGLGEWVAVPTLHPYGGGFLLCAWIAMSSWFSSIADHPESMYRRELSLMPVVILALICLTFSASVIWLVAMKVPLVPLVQGGGTLPTRGWAILASLFYIPTAPLVSFVLLIIHIGQVRAARTSQAEAGER